MTQVQEYLRNKRVQNLPKLYTVKSTKDSVEKFFDRQVIEIKEGVAFQGDELTGLFNKRIDRFKLEDMFPYEVDILIGETSCLEHGYGTGIGDLHSWTYFSSFSQEDAEDFYQKELIRLNNGHR